MSYCAECRGALLILYEFLQELLLINVLKMFLSTVLIVNINIPKYALHLMNKSVMVA